MRRSGILFTSSCKISLFLWLSRCLSVLDLGTEKGLPHALRLQRGEPALVAPNEA